jgi:hypothetical protein
MATRGYGYARIVAEYEDSTSDNQILRLKAIPNPNQVLPDPDAESTSGADWQYLFFVHTVTSARVQARLSRRADSGLRAGHHGALPAVVRQRRPRADRRVLVRHRNAVADGKGRPRTVCQYITNGVELLQKPGKPKKTEWKGSTIPFAAAFGKIIYETDDSGNTQKMLQSYIRLARDAAKAYNWTASTKLEALALPVKASLFAYEGQLDQTKWRSSSARRASTSR